MKNGNLQHWRPELRRAVMKARPEFFAWSVEQQERWGLAMPEKDCACFEEQLADVRRTYDPKVARLVKRRKVMVRKGAFDEL